MAINPSDTVYGLIKETTAGTTPTTPPLKIFDYIPGDMPNFGADTVTSAVLQPNRASGGARKTNYKVGGSLKTQLRRGGHIDLLLESALSNAFSTNVLKASNLDQPFSVEKKMLNGATPYYHRFKGCQVSSFGLSCTSTTAAEASFTLIGMDRATSATTDGTYTAVTASQYLTGLDVVNFTVAGLTGTFRSLDLTVSHNREAQDQFGVPAARAIGTSGFRTVTLKVTLYREDLSADTLLAKSDAPVAVSFDIGGVGTGYTVSLPAANYDVPQDSEDNSKSLITITFTASLDTVSGTDLIITKL